MLCKGGSLREGGAPDFAWLGRGGFFLRVLEAFFRFFFPFFLRRRFRYDFSSILEGFGKPKCVRNLNFGKVFGMFFWYPHFEAFIVVHVDVFLCSTS